MKKTLFVSLLTLVTACLFGCTSTPPIQHQPAPPPLTMEEETGDYIISPGDVMDIKLYFYSHLNETVKVRPDGKISLQLVDDVEAAGLTPAELDKVLTEKYTKVLQMTEISVIIREISVKKIFVGGEVNRPGLVPSSRNQTSLQAIFQAGGFKSTAEMQNVVILRNSGTSQPLYYSINLKDDLTLGTPRNDIILHPYDCVFVPKTTIAEMNQFVEQYIDKLIPISMNLGFNWVYDLNNDKLQIVQ